MVSDANGATSCPGTYATPLGSVNAGLNAPAANCACGCFVSGVDCFIGSGNTGGEFEPAGSCDSPPTEDDCLSAQLSASCTATGSETITPISWTTTRLTCGGATSTESCSGGACFPSASAFGSVCISQNADVSCPSTFPNRSSFFRGVADTRSCTACGCFTQGHSCEIEIQVCSLGFYDVTLSTDLGNEACLTSSDGDGVTLLSTSVAPGGTCSTTGGVAQGSAVPINPVTLCCL